MTIVTLYPTKDTWIRTNYPDANYGSTDSIQLRYAPPNDNMHSLLSFDLSGIPLDAVFNSVKLKLYCVTAQNSTETTYFNVHRLLVSWTELGATWNKRDGTNSWSTAGAQGSDTDRAASALGSGSVAAVGWLGDISFTNLDEFRAMCASNYGMLLLPYAAAVPSTKAITSREGTNKPRLVIDYTPGGAQAVWFS